MIKFADVHACFGVHSPSVQLFKNITKNPQRQIIAQITADRGQAPIEYARYIQLETLTSYMSNKIVEQATGPTSKSSKSLLTS
jgi:hypothetical protein